MKKKIVSIVLALAMAIGVFAMVTPAADETYKLSFAIHQPETTAFTQGIKEWAAAVEEQSGGRLVIDIAWGGSLASAQDAVDVVRQGGADICWNTVSLNPGYFTYCNILSMYGEELKNAQLTTYVYSNLCKNEPAFADEFKNMGVVLLGCHGMTPSLLAGNDAKIEALTDFQGKSIQSISKTCIAVLEALGAAVQGATPADLYENLAKNVVSGTLVDSSLFVSNKLYEQFSWMNTYNYNSALAFIIMNESKYNSLPEDLQQILMDNFDTLSFACAKYTDEDLTYFIENTVPEYGIEVYDASEEVTAAINEQLDLQIKQPWAEKCAAAGYDTAAIEQEIETLIEEGRAQYGEQYDWFK